MMDRKEQCTRVWSADFKTRGKNRNDIFMDTPSEVSALTPQKEDSEQRVLSGVEAEGGRDESSQFTLLGTWQIFTWQTLGALIQVWPMLLAWLGLQYKEVTMYFDLKIHTCMCLYIHMINPCFSLYIKTLVSKPKLDPSY